MHNRTRAPGSSAETRISQSLTSQAARERGLFRRDYVDALLAAPGEHLTPLRGSKLWQLGLLEWWLQTHLEGQA